MDTEQKKLNPVKWGLCGAGDICEKRVAPALRDLPSCDPLSLSRRNTDLLKDFAGRFGFARTFTDWREQFRDPSIEALYIATPVHLHCEQTIYAAEQGKHILCEKPMALDSHEARKMIDAARANSVKLGIAYYRRFYPVVQRIKEILASGTIGDPVFVNVLNFTPFDRKPGEPRYWLLEPEKSGGGPMMDMGCHRIELLQHLLGTVNEVNSSLENLRYERAVEDTAITTLHFEKNITAQISSLHSVSESKDTLEIFGTAGSISVSNLNKGFLALKTDMGVRDEKWEPLKNAHEPLIDDFAQAVRKNREPAVNGSWALNTTEILDQIYGR